MVHHQFHREPANSAVGCAAGYPGARRLRWRWKDGSSGVPRWRVVDLAFIQWRRDRNNMGWCATEYTPQSITAPMGYARPLGRISYHHSFFEHEPTVLLIKLGFLLE